ncbi:TetR family transcriptional regulator [Janibacter alittae]|uniref:TetR family transcriptional regulator n=1 Tax=Janibacter alittae TaxID=3115209 RepID=A0ABZ2MJF8_9MICO
MPTPDQTVEPLGRRERKKVETRRAIRDAALALALEGGVDGMTVARISEVADIAPRTFFNYFSCKEDALVTDGAGAGAQLREAIVARPEGEAPVDALRAAIIASDFVAGMQSGREQMRQRHCLIQDDPALLTRQLAQFAAVERAFAEGVAVRTGLDPDDLRPATLAALALGVVRVAVRRWTADGSESPADLIASGFDLLQHGVFAEGATTRPAEGATPA